MMRTTLNLPDDVYEIARSVAQQRHISLGDALAELVHRGLQARHPRGATNGFPTFPARPGAKPITLEQTLAAEDDL